MIDIEYGIKTLKKPEYILKRIKPTGLFKWFKNDQAELIGKFGKITGDYDTLVKSALAAGIRFKIKDDNS